MGTQTCFRVECLSVCSEQLCVGSILAAQGWFTAIFKTCKAIIFATLKASFLTAVLPVSDRLCSSLKCDSW